MGLLDFLGGSKAVTMVKNNMPWKIFGGQAYSMYKTDYREAIQKGYEMNVDVYAIVGDISSRAVEVPLEMYQANSKQQMKSLARYKALSVRPTERSIMEANSIRKNNMKEVEANPILELLKRPNGYQTQKQFFDTLFSYDLLLKDVGIWAEEDPLKPGKIARLHVIAPWDYQIFTDGFRVITGYHITSLNLDVDPKWFLSFRSFNPSFNDQTTIPRGFSPLTAGSRVLQKANAAEEVGIENFETRGAVGFVYKDDLNVDDLDPEQQGAFEDRMYDKIYNSSSKGRVQWSNAKVGYTKLSTTNIDLDLRAMSKLSTEQLCRLWHYPYVLLNADNLTESNLAHFIRRMIINCVIPMQSRICEGLLEWLAPTIGINASQYVLRFDTDAYPEMKQNFLDAATILDKLDGVLSQDEKRVFMDFEPTYDPAMQQVYIKSNQVPVSSLNIDPTQLGSMNE